MDLSEQTKRICQKYNIKPSRSKGQNFLVNEIIYDKIVAAADLQPDVVVLEVGPGLGFLTERLAKKVKQVVAVELDDKIAKVLRFRMKEQGIGNVSVVNENILEARSKKLEVRNKKFKIVANLPYNITSIFLRQYLSAEIKPKSMVLMVQKEVAERITAKPRTFRKDHPEPSKEVAEKVRGKPGKMSLLAVSVQYYAEPKIIEYVQKDNFWPRPEVDSAILRLDTKSTKKYEINEREFFRLVRIGFSARRKMLKNNLGAGYNIISQEAGEKIKMAGFSEKIRAQELSVPDWVKLFGFFK